MKDVGARHDPDLVLSPLPDRIARLGEVAPDLELAGPAADVPFAVEGEAVSALGVERGPVAWVRVGGRVVAAGLAPEESTVANVVVSPGLIRRERLVAGGYVTETALAAPTLPLLVWQFGGPGPEGAGPGAPDGLTVACTVLPGSAALRHHAADGQVVAVDDAWPDEPVTLAVVPAPRSLEVEAEPGGGLRVRMHLSLDGPATVLLTAGPDARRRTALSAGGFMDAHERRAGAAPDEGLTVRSGVGGVDDSVAWARARVVASIHRQEPATLMEPLFHAGMGALAVGHEDAARHALAVMEDLPIPGDPLPVLLAGRVALTTGDTRAALAWHERLRSEDLDGPPALRSRALLTLADSLAQAAGEDEIAELRKRARLRPAGAGPVRLPMAGQAPSAPDHPSDALAWLLGDTTDRATGPGNSVPDELAAWVALRRGRIDEGWQRWRAEGEAGLDGGPTGRGSWDDLTGGPGAPLAGIHLCTLLHGVLGWEPDAPMHRLTLTPTLPAHLTRLTLEHVVVGDVRLDLAYERDGPTLSWRMTPTTGRSPPMLVFGPIVPGRVSDVHLDDETVDAATHPGPNGGTRVPFQFPLDRPRTVTIRLVEPD
ncbi:MAG: hypothetical protein RJQ04_13470 [Longimicrobiales bacterium]